MKDKIIKIINTKHNIYHSPPQQQLILTHKKANTIIALSKQVLTVHVYLLCIHIYMIFKGGQTHINNY